jgi:hypothetical protein
MDAVTAPLDGGCACGRIRYRLQSRPCDTGYCHWGICRRCSGAPAVVYASVPLAHFEMLQGNTRTCRSTHFGVRGFCGDCGSALRMRVAHEPDVIDVTVATLDTPDAVPPGSHIWTESRVPWFDTRDDLPRFPASRSA